MSSSSPLRRCGVETTTYVRNIFKYYVAYLIHEQTELQKKLRKQVKKGS